MPKIISHPTLDTLFLRNDVPYDKNLWEIYFTGRIKNDDFDDSNEDLRIGIRHIYRRETLQTPVPLSSYVNSSDVPYTDLDTLLGELRVAIGDVSAGAGGTTSSTTGGVDGTNTRLDTVISEHDQTQAAIATQQGAITNALNNQLNILLNLNNELTGAVKEGFVIKVENGDSGAINNVQNVSFVFSGTDDGRLNNVEVPDGFNTSFVPNKSGDLIEEIDYQAPQTGFVIITGING